MLDSSSVSYTEQLLLFRIDLSLKKEKSGPEETNWGEILQEKNTADRRTFFPTSSHFSTLGVYLKNSFV